MSDTTPQPAETPTLEQPAITVEPAPEPLKVPGVIGLNGQEVQVPHGTWTAEVDPVTGALVRTDSGHLVRTRAV